jgi:hypothetical protein
MSLAYRMVDVDVQIDAPPHVAELLGPSYRRFPQAVAPLGERVVVRVDESPTYNSISVNGKTSKTVSHNAGGGALAVEMANAIIGAVAERSRCVIFHAAALERAGKALLLAAPTFCGKTLLSTHLVARGWRMISDEYAFVDPGTRRVTPFPKLVYLRWTSLPLVPRSYRRAIELSPWRSIAESGEIVFTAADPAEGFAKEVWSEGALFTHLLVFSWDRAERAAIQDCEAWSVIPETNSLVWQPANFLEGLSRLALSLNGVRVGRLTPSMPIETASIIERWYAGTLCV